MSSKLVTNFSGTRARHMVNKCSKVPRCLEATTEDDFLKLRELNITLYYAYYTARINLIIRNKQKFLTPLNGLGDALLLRADGVKIPRVGNWSKANGSSDVDNLADEFADKVRI
jgi:hypothetical protein